MEMNAISSVGSAASQKHLAGQSTEEAIKEKPNTAQEKAPSSPSSEEAIISSTGAQLSARAEASEESNAENDPEKNREANKTADASRVQNQQAEKEELSPEERINKLSEASQADPSAVYLVQANVSQDTVEALFV